MLLWVFSSLFIPVLSLEIKLLEGDVWDAIKQFNPTSFLCLSQASIWISKVICCGIFCVEMLKMRNGCLFCNLIKIRSPNLVFIFINGLLVDAWEI